MNFTKTFKTLFTFICSLLLFCVSLNYAQALPLFSRQTGQSCVACHAGGQYPELTPFGRHFKLTGYTMGTRQNIPVSVHAVVGVATSEKGNNGPSQNHDSGKLKPNYLFLDIGGKIFDNFGAFSQWYYAYDEVASEGSAIKNKNQFGADVQDWRYADHYAGDSKYAVKDIIWGASLNNYAGVTDVWNSSPMWMYPYMGSTRNYSTYGLPYNTRLSAYSINNPGYGVYAYINQNFYVEADLYQSGGSGLLSWMTYPASDTNRNFAPTYLKGVNPYFRLAYQSDEHNGHNWMLGLLGANINQYTSCGTDTSCGQINSPNKAAGTVKYQDIAIDGQYQYLVDPHAFTSQFRYTTESISDSNKLLYSNQSNNTNSFMWKASYAYNATYGTALAFQNINGSSDSKYDPNYRDDPNYSYKPNSTLWIPSVWYQPMENIRFTFQYFAYTKFNGGTTNYDGKGDNAKDNNASWFFLWWAM